MSKPKFKVGDLVVYRGTLGRIVNAFYINNEPRYQIGEFNNVEETSFTLADHRDITKIIKGTTP